MASMLPTAPWCDRMISAGRTVPSTMACTDSFRHCRPSVGMTTVKSLATVKSAAMGLSVIGIGPVTEGERARILAALICACPRNAPELRENARRSQILARLYSQVSVHEVEGIEHRPGRWEQGVRRRLAIRRIGHPQG